ncbi:MAG: phage tail assembly chaperone [Sphingomonadaceae bacterium]
MDEKIGSFADVAVTAARMATGVLGWPPEQFWQATVTDLVLALEGRNGSGDAGADASDLARLLKEFPDE